VDRVSGPPEPELADLAVARAAVAERLTAVRRVLPVMSGKGGVGKTAVAVNLALALARAGARVGLLDADLSSPSVALMLGLRGRPLRVKGTELLPTEGPVGLAVQSMDFFLQGTQPLDWEGPEGEGAPWRSALEAAALADLLAHTAWGALDTLVVDLAPGSDRLPALARLLPRRGLVALAVTIPTEVSLLAVERSVRRAREARVPLIGLVENMGAVVCAACGHEGELFRESPVEPAAAQLDLPLLARVPFDARLAAAADAGRPFLAGEEAASPAGTAFATLAERVSRYALPEDDEDEEELCRG
jgi:ATP-binding protein involved in chromosome partitioning